jgi:hypothetical protein
MLNAEEMADFGRTQLADYKVPSEVVFTRHPVHAQHRRQDRQAGAAARLQRSEELNRTPRNTAE